VTIEYTIHGSGWVACDAPNASVRPLHSRTRTVHDVPTSNVGHFNMAIFHVTTLPLVYAPGTAGEWCHSKRRRWQRKRTVPGFLPHRTGRTRQAPTLVSCDAQGNMRSCTRIPTHPQRHGGFGVANLLCWRLAWLHKTRTHTHGRVRSKTT